jgi:hypothetical protein
MSNDRLPELLSAIDLAAFERRRDGSFRSIAPPPSWFARLSGDPTFPFLGHILEEAMQFWSARIAGKREWGPCAEVDEHGKQFHYRVVAVNSADTAYLLFALDGGSEEMRDVLQRVRQQMLDAEQAHGEIRRAAGELRALAGAITASASDESRHALASSLSEKCDDLLRRVDALVTKS